MPFPYTLNGNLWTSSQFTPSEIARNLGPFLYDLLTQNLSIIELSGLSFTPVIGTPATFTVPSGMRFQTGMRVVLGFPLYPRHKIYALVSAYTGTSMDITPLALEPDDAGLGTVTAMTIVPAGLLDTTYTAAGYLNPALTGSAARDAAGLHSIESYWPEVFEDFRGYKPAARNGTYKPDTGGTFVAYGKDPATEEINHKWGLVCFGRGTAETMDQKKEMPSALVRANRVGFMELCVRLPNDVAGIVMDGVCLGSGASAALGTKFKVAFMLPRVPHPTDAKFYVTMGLLGGDSGTFERPSTPGYQLVPPPVSSPGVSYPRTGDILVIDNAVYPAPAAYLSSDARTTEILMATEILAGIWYTYTITLDSSTSMTVELQGDDGSYETHTQVSATGLNRSPFFAIGKTVEAGGSEPYVAYVDYMYLSALPR